MILKIVRSASEYNFQDINNISFIPTMGNLHVGHLELIKAAHSYKGFIVVSIFVNSLQFNDKKDFINYPSTIEEDLAALEEVGCDLVFLPDQSILKNIDLIKAPNTANKLCGSSRPGHFDGVLTIINKFFKLINPEKVYFGLKDFQQYMLIKDFSSKSFPKVSIKGIPTVRDSNGLALSSRNNLLNKNQLLLASNLFKEINNINEYYLSKDTKTLIDDAINNLSHLGFEIDYLTVCDAETFDEVSDATNIVLIAVAAYLNEVRLIDNIQKKI